MTYLWLKAGHIIFVIFWMAGLFLLPRYFIYHQEAGVNAPEAALWVRRERMLLRIILWPSMTLVWLFGLALAHVIGASAFGWFHAKAALVLMLTGYQVWLATYAGALAQGRVGVSGKTLRMLNEVPGLAAVLIVVLVVVKPF